MMGDESSVHFCSFKALEKSSVTQTFIFQIFLLRRGPRATTWLEKVERFSRVIITIWRRLWSVES